MTAASARLVTGRGVGLFLGVAGLMLIAVVCGIGVAMGELEAAVTCLALLACCAVFADFRVGAVLVMLMLPVERSVYFPHSVFGIIGLNPLNLVLAATLASFLLRGQNLARFVPKPLFFLVVVPMLIAGLIGMRHVSEIHPGFYEAMLINFTDAFGYYRDIVVKPLFIVLGALLVGAAVARSQKPERFLAPVILSVWMMSLMSIVFVAVAGMSLGALSMSGSREFFSALGLHA